MEGVEVVVVVELGVVRGAMVGAVELGDDAGASLVAGGSLGVEAGGLPLIELCMGAGSSLGTLGDGELVVGISGTGVRASEVRKPGSSIAEPPEPSLLDSTGNGGSIIESLVLKVITVVSVVGRPPGLVKVTVLRAGSPVSSMLGTKVKTVV